MKDRFALAGALALLLAVVSTVWLQGSRTTTSVGVQTSSPISADLGATLEEAGAAEQSAPTEPDVAPTASPSASEVLVVALDGLGGAGVFAQPGDHVTLLGFIPAELNQGSAMTRVVLPDVTVLQGSADTALTVVVSPEQALFVRSAQSLGVRMFAALRPAEGSTSSPAPEVVSERDLRAILRTSP